jgi:hypothetical protein
MSERIPLLSHNLNMWIATILQKLTANQLLQKLHILCNLNIHYQLHNIPPYVLILSQKNPKPPTEGSLLVSRPWLPTQCI